MVCESVSQTSETVNKMSIDGVNEDWAVLLSCLCKLRLNANKIKKYRSEVRQKIATSLVKMLHIMRSGREFKVLQFISLCRCVIYFC